MLLYIEDTYAFPEATRDDIQKAFDAFDTFTPDIARLGHLPGDLDLAADLGKRELTFTWFIDMAADEDEWPRFFTGYARDIAAALASGYMLHCDLPRTVVNNWFSIRAGDDSFLATGELVFAVPAP